MGCVGDGTVVLRWRRHPSSVGLARLELRKSLAGWGLSALEDSAVLVLSELVTNAVRHARVPSGREIETRFLPMVPPKPSGLRIEVHDTSALRPRLRAAEPDACDGRGLLLVDALADEWGVADRVAWASSCGHCGGPPPMASSTAAGVVTSDPRLRTLWARRWSRSAGRGGSCPWGCCTLDVGRAGPRLAERFIAYRRDATDTPSR
ncbi:ATP-binding protein [Streptomyces niveus]|uniref:ATP-binding protein n=1 Tax=Streptomyces niveus TaxID=193462 RepID=UPI0038363D68